MAMNILYLKYALEVAETGSVNRAAENLYMAQPNLSRAIKELEASLGITIFERTSRGMNPTPDGEKLLRYAAGILRQVDEVENMFRGVDSKIGRFSLSAPRACYIADAFTRFSKKLDSARRLELFYHETDPLRAITNVLYSDYNLGIVRYAAVHDRYYKELLGERGLTYEPINEFNYLLVMSRRHPLAKKEQIHMSDLEPYVEISHADSNPQSVRLSDARKQEMPDNIGRKIFIFERATQFELLESNTDSFMWMSPLSDEKLEKWGLVQRECADNRKKYRDLLIYREDYRLSELDLDFIKELKIEN